MADVQSKVLTNLIHELNETFSHRNLNIFNISIYSKLNHQPMAAIRSQVLTNSRYELNEKSKYTQLIHRLMAAIRSQVLTNSKYELSERISMRNLNVLS